MAALEAGASGRADIAAASGLDPEVVDTAPLRLRPLAGAIPLGGASGGAIVNRRGELIGLFNAVVTAFEGDGVVWWLTGASTAALPDALRR